MTKQQLPTVSPAAKNPFGTISRSLLYDDIETDQGTPKSKSESVKIQHPGTEKIESTSFMEAVYSPESLLASWINTSFFSVTAALIFFDQARKSPNFSTALAGLIGIGLILISVGYVAAGLPFYLGRMFALEEDLSDEDTRRWQWHVAVYGGLTAATITIELVICYYLFRVARTAHILREI